MMDRNLAIELLKAMACCSIPKLHCYECPLYNEDTGRCRAAWAEEEIAAAVRTLNAERRTE